jgi:hypothetical protein
MTESRLMLAEEDLERAPMPKDDVLQLSHLAEESRAMADTMSDAGARKTMIGIAEAYERMVKLAELRARDSVAPR